MASRKAHKPILQKIGGENYAAAALAEIEATLVNEIEQVNFRDLLEPKMRKVLLLGVALAVFQQWCGINVIFNYAEEIFRAAGYDISSVLNNIAWTGSVNLAFTFVALGVVDRGGRRPLMLFGAAGLAVIYMAMGFCYHAHVQGLADAAAGAGGHRVLLDVAGAGDVGGDLGNFPEPHPRRGDGGGRGGVVAGVFHPDLHVSDFERAPRRGRHVLALRGDLRAGFHFHLFQAAGNQKQNA